MENMLAFQDPIPKGDLMPARRAIVGVLLGVFTIGATACDNSPREAQASPTSASTIAERCHAKVWPQALPDLRGERLVDAELGDGVCFAIDSAIGPDGTNVLDKSNSPIYLVIDQSPAPGTLVGEQQSITLSVAESKPN
ncbi:PASTA domain-containing protein [Nocardia sp. NPDC056000]|uniref:PASTA domain-containing protein n=1 Tax=Nocardia sp. NPDC056000 TaxID=3345674 RepID=UPI0035E1DABF